MIDAILTVVQWGCFAVAVFGAGWFCGGRYQRWQRRRVWKHMADAVERLLATPRGPARPLPERTDGARSDGVN